MSYGLKYLSNFDSFNGVRYTLSIYEKDYSGSSTNIILGGSPAIQDWSNDNYFAPVMGCSLSVEIVSEGISLTDLYSTNDDNFKVELVSDNGVHFTGFLVQDDCREIQVDFLHYIQISATDNLGLLKDVPFDDANSSYGTVSSFIRTITRIDAHNFTFSGSPLPLAEGQIFTITGLTGANGAYTCQNITYLLGTFKINVIETIPTFTGGVGTVEYTTAYFEITDKLKLSEILAICLNATGLTLDTNVYSDLQVDGGSTGRWLEDAYLSGETFLSGEKWENCYNVISYILSRFRASLFQSNGIWNIVRWDELRENANVIPYHNYDSDFTYLSTVTTYDNVFNYDAGDIISGLELSILRPYKFVKQTFNYVQPDNLLRNYNLQTLGTLIRTYTSGANTVNEYELALWDDGIAAPYPERFIRIILDSTGTEISRYAVITGPTGDSSRSAQSKPIEVIAGDKFKWSFSYRTDVSQPGAVNSVFSVRLFDGTTTRYLGDNGEWKIPNGFTYSVLAGDNTNEWHSVEIECQPIPYTGLIYIYLGEQTAVDTDDTLYKDLYFEYIPSVNDTTKIIGHTHTNTHPVNTKNVDDFDIQIDDSPRNSIKGTLFLSTSTSLVRDRTSAWLPDNLKIGQITTYNELQWRSVSRSLLSGTLIGIIQSGNVLTKLSIINSTIYPAKIFIIGQLSIDYKNETANVNLFEMYDDTETGMESVYEFKYLYAKI